MVYYPNRNTPFCYYITKRNNKQTFFLTNYNKMHIIKVEKRSGIAKY